VKKCTLYFVYLLSQIGLSASTIASSFGRTISENKELSDYRPEDISLSLLRMISYNIGQVRCSDVDIGFTGNIIDV
jgi:pantothenate kinase